MSDNLIFIINLITNISLIFKFKYLNLINLISIYQQNFAFNCLNVINPKLINLNLINVILTN